MQPPKRPTRSFFNRPTKNETTHDKIDNTIKFYVDDFPKTLFPLKTNKFLIQKGEAKIKNYIDKCFDQSIENYRFIPQSRVYAAKTERHLRRTMKLDVASEYFIYDVIYRNRNLFRKPFSDDRQHYGYRFENGNVVSPTLAFKAFKGAISQYSKAYSYSLGFDVASYFNHVYHHDLVAWFSELGANEEDTGKLGTFLREIRHGRSIDCLPQGIYPTKMIGNDFLRFIDNYHEIKSSKLIRFMDDIYIFSNDKVALENDFQTIQRRLGEKGLSVNPQKTKRDAFSHLNTETQIDKVKTDLLQKRRLLVTTGYDDAGNDIVKEQLLKFPLTEEETGYINSILNQADLEEEDAELILTIMRDNTSLVEKKIPYILENFPHLTKNVYTFLSNIENKDFAADTIANFLKSNNQIMEFQLFWFGYILEEYLINTKFASNLISLLFNHKSATSITKAKILEIQSSKYGLPELRDDFLGSGQSDWLAWSSAVGSNASTAVARNHRLKYFGNSSNLNNLIATIILDT